MTRKLVRLFIALLGGALGVGIVAFADNLIIAFGGLGLEVYLHLEWVYAAGAVLSAIIFYFLSPMLIDSMAKMLHLTEERLTTMPLMDMLVSALGLIIGLLVALLLSTLVNKIPLPWLVTPISAGLYLFCGYLGVSTAIKRRSELRDPNWAKLTSKTGSLSSRTLQGFDIAKQKILDTSVIIDGRIFDICATGVMEGTLVVPGFILKELRHIADSTDALKRGRGRRGLDILQRMQKELPIAVRIEERDYEEIAEVDLKLLRLAQELNGVVITNDYNLNKVAAVQEVPVFNINDLANAIKPVLLPGEEIRVTVVKEGKEAGQGIGYLDDGTMIVVDGGKKMIGEDALSIVTSVLQTSAGRMIFARVK